MLPPIWWKNRKLWGYSYCHQSHLRRRECQMRHAPWELQQAAGEDWTCEHPPVCHDTDRGHSMCTNEQSFCTPGHQNRWWTLALVGFTPWWTLVRVQCKHLDIWSRKAGGATSFKSTCLSLVSGPQYRTPFSSRCSKNYQWMHVVAPSCLTSLRWFNTSFNLGQHL